MNAAWKTCRQIRLGYSFHDLTWSWSPCQDHGNIMARSWQGLLVTCHGSWQGTMASNTGYITLKIVYLQTCFILMTILRLVNLKECK